MAQRRPLFCRLKLLLVLTFSVLERLDNVKHVLFALGKLKPRHATIVTVVYVLVDLGGVSPMLLLLRVAEHGVVGL